MKKKLLFLPLEIKTRELYSKLYFATKALNQNYACFIGDKPGIFRATKYFNNGVYFYKSINIPDTEHITQIKKKNNNYVVLDEEGGFTLLRDKDIKDFINHRSSKINVSLIDRFFNWGSFDYNHYIKLYPKFKKKFLITGGLRFEIGQKSIIKKIYNDQINFTKSQYGTNYILLISSHGVTSLRELKQMFKSDVYYMELKTKKQRQNRYAVLNELYKLNIDFKKLITSIIKNFPNQKFIIRPHPSENIKDWNGFILKNLKDQKNFSVDVENDLNALIFNSNGIISSKSGASIQALLQKKPIISYNPNFIKHELRLPDYLGHISKSKKDVIKNLKKMIINESLSQKRTNMLPKHVNNFNTKLKPSTIILKNLKLVYKSKSNINILIILFLSPIYFFFDFIFSKFKLRYYKKNELVYRTQAEKMSKEGIKKQEIINAINNVQKKNNIKVLSFGKNCFFLYK